MAITKLVLDRQAAGRVFAFGTSAASADVTLTKASTDGTETVLLTNEASADIKGNLKVTGSISVNGGIDAQSTIISNVAGPTSSMDAANKNYVDTVSASIASDVAAQEVELLSISGSVVSLDAEVVNLSGSVVTLTSDVLSVSSSVVSLGATVEAVSSSVVTIDTLIPVFSASIVILDSTVSEVSSSVVDLYASQSQFAKLSGGNTFSGNQQFNDDVTIQGNFTVNGSQTIISSSVLDIGDNIISLNGTSARYAGLEVNDPTAPNVASGSLLWDRDNDYWIAGPQSLEKRIVIADYGTAGQVLTIDALGEAVFSTPTATSAFKRVSYTGNIDGNNKIFNIQPGVNFVADSEQVILNGIILTPGSGNDYTFLPDAAGGYDITLESGFPAPVSGDNLQVFASY